MCRLYGFLANEPTKVDCSLVFSQNALMQQSRADLSGRDHADGWGIATYAAGQPAVQKKTTAAYADRHFSSTAEKAYSATIIAHVRRATVGGNSLANTHPFTFGPWTFAHNGTITGFTKVAPVLEMETDSVFQQTRQGETDSEQYFLWLLTHLKSAGAIGSSAELLDCSPAVERLNECVHRLSTLCNAADSEKIPRLNFVLTNGEILMACRWNNSLFSIRREGLYDCEICGIPHIHHDESVTHRAVAFASEPVTHEAWDEVPNHSVTLIDPLISVTS